MLKRIHLAVVGAVAILASGVVAAQAGIGGPGFKRSEAAPPATMTRERAAVAREAAQAAPNLDGWQYVGGEAGWALAPQTRASETRIAAPAMPAYAETADEWTYVGGEAGWILTPHEYAFRNGRLIYVDKRFPHDTPAALKPTAQEQARLQSQVGGR